MKSDLEERKTGKKDEKCPICRNDAYLNPNMRFLINPECYHKMCESCVARIFTLGPSPCPKCGKILRKGRFREKTFEDIAVEREIDIRKRISKICNKRPEDFETLMEYNDYLEEVEDITFNLVNNIDVEETEAKLIAYEAINKKSIMANAQKAELEAQIIAKNEDRLKKEKKISQEMIIKEKEAEHIEKEEYKQELIRELASSDKQASKVVEHSNALSLKRSTIRKQRAAYEAKIAMEALPAFQNSCLNKDEEKLDVFSPMAGQNKENTLYVVKESYNDSFLKPLLENKAIRGGGFNINDVYKRVLFEAFASLYFDNHSNKSQTNPP
ncbi:CDK-activating kinase assembly factor MAT1 [Pneumocystis carinii B80]|uniref:RNA polymerase II transcription factor B subunit 3 n=1 Tax=Pneumocystis carinii (strain B80) TaxID=1408658 RepID=A0A0W4ZDI1_PNEC8|nr:CDK-activating kinase assembly factor MAT1 [Pneumocystis carinii B80]KTW26378.1 CDK-activating kinase assembly factor MAT1 [Pneumocystis carinii B80]